MGEQTGISWCHHTHNHWVGCAKVSPACDGCYAEHLMETRMKRVVWGGPGKGAGTRDLTSEANRRKPQVWNRAAAKAGEPRFVFCSSLADVFDNQVPAEWRRELFDLIRATPHLTWLLLTKRPQLIERLYGEAHLDPPDGGGGYDWPKNAFAGTTVEDPARADLNIIHLARAGSQLGIPLIFLSCEPLLGGIDLFNLDLGRGRAFDAFAGVESGPQGATNWWKPIGWVITGGETDQGKHKARPTHPDWLRAIRDACATTGVPYHHKQNGEWLSSGQDRGLCARLSSEERVLRHGEWSGHAISPAQAMEDGTMNRVGKKHSGRLLDGVLHDAMPEVRT